MVGGRSIFYCDGVCKNRLGRQNCLPFHASFREEQFGSCLWDCRDGPGIGTRDTE